MACRGVTATETHARLGYDMASCKFDEGRAAVSTIEQRDQAGTTSAAHHDTCTHRHAYAQDGRHHHDGVVKCLTSRP